MFDAYVEHKNGNIPAEQVHHQYMAGHYIELIATGLKEFDTRNHNNPEINMDHYRALAWGGLRGSKTWNDLQQEIKNGIDSKTAELIDWHSVINCN